MSRALDCARSVSILAVQCSCSWVESRDRACVSEPPTRWERTGLYPCRHLDSPNRAGRLPTAQRVRANTLSEYTYREAVTNLPRFSDLGLSAPILRALAAEGYAAPTPIQFQAIPPGLGGRDLCGIAQTGTGKTAAFALPILQRLAAVPRRATPHTCRVLVLSPTRELASQIAVSFRAYSAGMPLSSVQVLVLDEADRMLDLGFIHALKRIVKLLPQQRQTLLFSATMPRPIALLAEDYLTDPVKVVVAPSATTVDRVEQGVVL